MEAIGDLQEQGQIPGIDFALEILAGVAASRGGIRRAARLWGAVAGYRDATGAPRIPEERAMIEAHIDAACTRLEEATLAGGSGRREIHDPGSGRGLRPGGTRGKRLISLCGLANLRVFPACELRCKHIL